MLCFGSVCFIKFCVCCVLMCCCLDFVGCGMLCFGVLGAFVLVLLTLFDLLVLFVFWFVVILAVICCTWCLVLIEALVFACFRVLLR